MRKYTIEATEENVLESIESVKVVRAYGAEKQDFEKTKKAASGRFSAFHALSTLALSGRAQFPPNSASINSWRRLRIAVKTAASLSCGASASGVLSAAGGCVSTGASTFGT